MLSIFDLAAFLVTLTALFAWFNQRYVRLPRNIGLLLMGLLASLTLVLIDLAIPQTDLYAGLTKAIKQIDFYAAVMNGMLGFLLFAGALHVDLSKLRARALHLLKVTHVPVPHQDFQICMRKRVAREQVLVSHHSNAHLACCRFHISKNNDDHAAIATQ